MPIPILMYHEVGPSESMTERYTVSTESFREQLQYLRDHQYQTLSLAQYRDAETGSRPFPGGRSVVITFDDNNLCHYSVTTPVLGDYGFSATFFIVSSFVDTKPDMLTSAQLLQMKAAGMCIESHSHTHRFLSDLAPAELRVELELSRRILEDLVRDDVRFMSCPGGRYSSGVLDTALDVGYWGVCTSTPGLNEAKRSPALRPLCRFLVSSSTSLQTFARIVSGDRRLVRREVLRDRAKSIGRRLLGNERYDRLWRRYRRDL